MTETIYVIERNGKYLDKLFTDNVNEMFNKTEDQLKKRGVYFYNIRLMAECVADELGAVVVPAFLDGDQIKVIKQG